jgi:lysozyme
MIKGIDVSHHQSKFDTSEMKADGLEFCILKCTQGPGDFVDPKFKERWKLLKQSGVIRGAYHFFEAAADGVKQADFMIKTINDAGGMQVGDLPPTLDWESDRYRKTYPIVSFAKQEANAIAFAKRIKEVLGVYPIFYTGRHRLAENKHSTFWSENCPLWEADYVGGLDIVAPYKKVHIWQRSDNAKRDADYSGGGDYNELQGDKTLLLSMTFGATKAETKVDEIPHIKPLPTEVPKVKITRDQLVDAMLANVKRLIDQPVRESNGANRSVTIDSWNKRTGVPMGTPYCASSIWCEWKDVCDSLGLKFPMRPTASSQAFVSAVPSKYVRKEGDLGRRGDAGVLQMSSDKSRGHMTILREDQASGSKDFKTYEFNTNSAGSRDGDGGYAKTRNTVDRSSANAGKLFRAFTDIPQWIIDSNS